MALTEQEETKVRSIITAFDNGKTIAQLPVGDTNNPSKYLIEGVSKDTGESVQIPFADAVSIVNKHIAIRRWKRSLSTPVGEAYGNIDFLRELPSILGLGCYLVSLDRSRRKLDPTNHHRFADGSPAALDGTMGDYLWCWNAHYYAWWVDSTYYYEAVSLTPIPGRQNYYIPAGGTSALGAGVIDRTTNTLVSVVSNDAKYRGGNNDANKDDKYNTFLGKVATNLPAATFGSYARKKGQGWEAGWYVANAVVGYLYRIIMGTRHAQSAFNPNKDANGLYQGGTGVGVTDAAGWWNTDFGYYPFLPTSAGIELGDAVGVSDYDVIGADGTKKQTMHIPCFFGLKNFYGHIGLIERGALMNKLSDGSADYYVAPSLYSEFNINSIDGLIKAAKVPANSPAGWKYITEMSMQNLCCAPTVATGTSETYYADGWYNDNATSGLRCPFRRGPANYGASAGLACLLGDSAVAYANLYWSSPLCYFAEDVSPVPVQN
ncbi:hypothetical protein [Parabacteroides goldsteinii]|uniref:hypothetical protein n=1 Tax=Parabacteroides goldsteinii TaxID=328812 RepID=UPI0032190B28